MIPMVMPEPCLTLEANILTLKPSPKSSITWSMVKITQLIGPLEKSNIPNFKLEFDLAGPCLFKDG